MPGIPQIKKRISAFLSSEEGKITKKSVLTMGIFAAGSAAAIALNAGNVEARHWRLHKLGTTDTVDGLTHFNHSSY